MKRKSIAAVPDEAAVRADESRFATVEVTSDLLVRDARGRFKEHPDLLHFVAALRVAVEHILGKAYAVDPECFIALGQYGFDLRSRNARQDDWARRDHQLTSSLAEAYRKLVANAASDRAQSLSSLQISPHTFAALKAIAAIRALEAIPILKTSDGTVSEFPEVDADCLAAAKGTGDKTIPVNGVITGVDSSREGWIYIRIDHGNWIRTTKGSVQELCEWFSEGKSVCGKAEDKDGVPTIDAFEVGSTRQSDLTFGRRKEPRQGVAA